MPELPEVEVTRQGLASSITGLTIISVTIRNHQLRWPVAPRLATLLTGAQVQTVARRGKFILIDCLQEQRHGTLLVHLGMTGTFRMVKPKTPVKNHDHIDLHFADRIARFNDPRRFGAFLWHDAAADGPIESNRHLALLGVEPLSEAFAKELGGVTLHQATRGKSTAVKSMLLAGNVVVGVGNIYCSEALFRSGINPKTGAGKISLMRYQRLAEAIRQTLSEAIVRGGSTLRDFVGADGAKGYFQQDYFVYGRTGEPCRVCGTPIKQIRQGQRSTFYCPKCQAR